MQCMHTLCCEDVCHADKAAAVSAQHMLCQGCRPTAARCHPGQGGGQVLGTASKSSGSCGVCSLVELWWNLGGTLVDTWKSGGSQVELQWSKGRRMVEACGNLLAPWWSSGGSVGVWWKPGGCQVELWWKLVEAWRSAVEACWWWEHSRWKLGGTPVDAWPKHSGSLVELCRSWWKANGWK
jgi:hypothetical protein